jgi:hypothetical protein
MGKLIYLHGGRRMGLNSLISTYELYDPMDKIPSETQEEIEQHKLKHKPKALKQLHEGNAKKRELADRFMARHYRRAEEKQPLSADPFGDLSRKLDLSLAAQLPNMSPSEAATYIRHANDMDEMMLTLNRQFGAGLTLPPTLFASQQLATTGIAEHANQMVVIDLQDTKRDPTQMVMRILKERKQQEPGEFKLIPLTPESLNDLLNDKESGHEQGTETPNRPN